MVFRDGRQQVGYLGLKRRRTAQNLEARWWQGDSKGLGGRLVHQTKYRPMASLVNAVTRGILPAYLTMAGQS